MLQRDHCTQTFSHSDACQTIKQITTFLFIIVDSFSNNRLQLARKSQLLYNPSASVKIIRINSFPQLIFRFTITQKISGKIAVMSLPTITLSTVLQDNFYLLSVHNTFNFFLLAFICICRNTFELGFS